jgi:hypothetical protein
MLCVTRSIKRDWFHETLGFTRKKFRAGKYILTAATPAAEQHGEDADTKQGNGPGFRDWGHGDA